MEDSDGGRLRKALTKRGLVVVPRSAWAPIGPIAGLVSEPDVRFLIVHHSDTPNDYLPEDVPTVLRSMYRFHVREKGWADVAYNFFVDHFGTVWEGRTGSLDRRVAGDATGGNQGSSQLCCFVGDFKKEPPTPQAWAAIEKLLAALADTAKIDTKANAQATFISRGSSRFAVGEKISVRTIEGHRTLSQTTCPGDLIYNRIASGDLAAAVTKLRT